MMVAFRQVSKERWLVGIEKEKEYNNIKREDLEERLSERRQVWATLLDLLKGEVTFHNSKRILDVGSEATSIFLVLREGEKYAVDPLFEYLFHLHPFLKEIGEYKDVNFISSPFEDMAPDKKFDVIFMLSVLEHMGTLKAVMDKIDELLASSGILVVFAECFDDPVARNITSFFDMDPHHPHHFVVEDIVRLFSSYRLRKQQKIWEVYRHCPFRKRLERQKIKIYRIDKLITRARQLSIEWGWGNTVLFASKVFLYNSLIFLIAVLRRRGRPIYPLVKPWLFVFQKP